LSVSTLCFSIDDNDELITYGDLLSVEVEGNN
jgi:hypothetical protein